MWHLFYRYATTKPWIHLIVLVLVDAMLECIKCIIPFWSKWQHQIGYQIVVLVRDATCFAGHILETYFSVICSYFRTMFHSGLIIFDSQECYS